jgi:hypothetical protein
MGQYQGASTEKSLQLLPEVDFLAQQDMTLFSELKEVDEPCGMEIGSSIRNRPSLC